MSTTVKISSNKFIECVKRLGYMSPTTVHDYVTEFNFGPLGRLLTENVFQQWWNSTVIKCDDIIFGDSTPRTPKIDWSKLDDNELMNCSTQYPNSYLTDFEAASKLVGGRLPFGIAQITKRIYSNASKHEMPKENTNMQLQFFCSPTSSTKWFQYWQRKRFQWWRNFSGEPGAFNLTETMSENNEQFINIEHKHTEGNVTVETIRKKQVVESLQSTIQGKDGRKVVTPHIIDCSSSLEMGVFIFLRDAFHKRQTDQSKIVFRFHPFLAPYKVFLATKTGANEDLQEHSQHLCSIIRKLGLTLFAEKTPVTLEQQFTKSDEMGSPYTVVLNDATLNSGVVSLRTRDTMLREDVSITELSEKLKKCLM